MSRFERAIPVVLEHEGRYSEHPDDPGGATDYGISLRFLRAAELDINRDGIISVEDVRALTPEIATEIYKERWWEKYRYYRINDQDVATKTLDLAVNMGGRPANRLLQQACRAAGNPVVEDALLGPETFGAVNRCDPGQLFASLSSEAAGRYRLLIQAKPSRKVFKNGWLNRAYSGPWFRPDPPVLVAA